MIKGAHDAVAARGHRFLHFPPGDFVAPDLWNCGDVVFVGEGRLVGTYQKLVVPLAAPGGAISGGGVVPALHLRRFARAGKACVCILGDSTSTAVQVSARTEYLWPLLQARLLQDNPRRPIAFVNRGVPGSTLRQADTRPTGLLLPSWYTDPGADWLAYVEAVRPDLLFVNFGHNDPAGFDLTHLASLVAKVCAWAPAPDIIICTPLVRSVMAEVGPAQRAAQDDRAFAAGALRTYAQANGFGLIDLHRASTIARDGWDIAAPALERLAAAEGPAALPWMAPEETTDFEVELAADNTGGAVFGEQRQLEVTLSRLGNNAMRIYQLGPRLWLTIYAGGSSAVVQLPPHDTGIAVPPGAFTLRVSAKGAFVSIAVDGNAVFEGLVVRHGGLFRPRAHFVCRSSDDPGLPVQVRRYVVARPVPSMPWVTDLDLFGDRGSPGVGFGGNGINHPAARGVAMVHAPLLERTRFSAAETQTGGGHAP